MKVSLSWLKQYVPVTLSHQEISDELTMAGLEVDCFSDRFDYMKTIVISKIVEISQHPNADKLRCCKVDAGLTEPLSIVCGAPNAKLGLVIPCALVGTQFPAGLVIKKSKLRGEKSEGMLCSASELGIGEGEAGIMELDESLIPGTPITEALNLSDAVFEIDLTPNRPDCLSLIGTARELASIQKEQLTLPCEPMPVENDSLGTITDHTSVTIEDPDLCPRYTARLVLDITVGPSPFWLQDRLLAVGLTPINNIVDVTNFVMMETWPTPPRV